MNNRLPKPMKFEIKSLRTGGICLLNKPSDYLITLGDIHLKKQKTFYRSDCEYFNEQFEYHGIENALCGKTRNSNGFTIKRFLVIQMK